MALKHKKQMIKGKKEAKELLISGALFFALVIILNLIGF